MPKKRIPSYRLHRPSGKAVVTLGGKDFYLGQYNSKASWDEYQRLIGEYVANNTSSFQHGSKKKFPAKTSFSRHNKTDPSLSRSGSRGKTRTRRR